MTTDIGARIREIRKAKGMKQVALARALGISKDFLCLLEQGKRGFSAERVWEASEGLDVTVGALYGETDWRDEVPQEGERVHRIIRKNLLLRPWPVLGSQTDQAVDILATWLVEPKASRRPAQGGAVGWPHYARW